MIVGKPSVSFLGLSKSLVQGMAAVSRMGEAAAESIAVAVAASVAGARTVARSHSGRSSRSSSCWG